MDSSKQANIRQDLKDYLDRMTFGLEATRRRRKNPNNPVDPVQKKKLNIQSIQQSLLV
jgi:tRNA C32,U32 (ribose-2'-O)-methylase TrmJ